MSDTKYTESIPAETRPGKDPPPSVRVTVTGADTDTDTVDAGTEGRTGQGRMEMDMERRDGEGEVDRKEAGERDTEHRTGGDREYLEAIPSNPRSQTQTRPTILTQAPSSSDQHAQSHGQDQANPEAEAGGAGGGGIGGGVQIHPESERPLNFQGFFVLVDDTKTGVSSHPHKIHYLFSDDEDVDSLTTSLLDNIPSSTGYHPSHDPTTNDDEADRFLSRSRSASRHSSSSDATYRSPRKPKATSRRERTRDRRDKERTIIIDISTSGDAIRSIHSLTDRWQVLGAQIGNAPTFESSNANTHTHTHTEEGAGGGGGGLMLRVEGVGREAFGDADLEGGLGRGKDGGGEMSEDEMRELMEGFERRLGMLRKVVEGGGMGAA